MKMKELLLQEISACASDLGGLLSLTLVGSHGDPSKELESTNDFDLLFIFDHFDKKKLEILKEKFGDLVKKLDAPNHVVWTEFRIGPVKPVKPRDAKMGTMLHLLLFDKQSFEKYIEMAPFASFNWSTFSPLVGEGLKELFEFPLPQENDLLVAKRHSIPFYRHMLLDKKYIIVNYKEESDEIELETKEFSVPEEKFPEFFSDIVDKTLLTVDIVYEKTCKTWSKEELADLFFKHLGEFSKYESFIREVLSYKKRVRSGEPLDIDNGQVESQILAFQDELIAFFQNK